MSAEFLATPGEEEEGSLPAPPSHMDTDEDLEEIVCSIMRCAGSYNHCVRVSIGEEDWCADIGNSVVGAVSNIVAAGSPVNGLWVVQVRVSCMGICIKCSLT